MYCILVLLLIAVVAVGENKDFNKQEDKDINKTYIIRSVNGKITVEEIDHKATDTAIKTNRYVPDTIDGQPSAEWIATHTSQDKNPQQGNKPD